MNIPDEAVEAAARAAYEHDRRDSPNRCTWEDASQALRDDYMECERKALEAAAPHIAAQAWGEATEAAIELLPGHCPVNWITVIRSLPNPYRSGT